jgi:hypothetical protein
LAGNPNYSPLFGFQEYGKHHYFKITSVDGELKHFFFVNFLFDRIVNVSELMIDLVNSFFEFESRREESKQICVSIRNIPEIIDRV